jgi:hypothetical protein
VTPPGAAGSGFEDVVFGHCRLVLGDFVDAIQSEPRTRAVVRFCVWSGAAACASGLYMLTTPWVVTGIVLFVLGALSCSAERAPEHVARRWFARTPPAARDLRFTLGPQGLIVASEGAHQLYRWQSLEGFHAAPRSLLVWVSPRLFVILPRRAFDAAELPGIVARLESRVGPPAAASRLWAGLAAALLLGLLALWAWNRLAPR